MLRVCPGKEISRCRAHFCVTPACGCHPASGMDTFRHPAQGGSVVIFYAVKPGRQIHPGTAQRKCPGRCARTSPAHARPAGPLQREHALSAAMAQKGAFPLWRRGRPVWGLRGTGGQGEGARRLFPSLLPEKPEEGGGALRASAAARRRCVRRADTPQALFEPASQCRKASSTAEGWRVRGQTA